MGFCLNNAIKILLAVFILFLCINMVSASDNISDENLEMDYSLDANSVSNDVEQWSIAEEDQLGNVCNATGNAFDDIQKAVDKSKSGDVINLEGEYISSGKSIKINKDLTIQGSNNTILKANGQSKCFQIVGSSKVIFKDLKIVDANQAIFSDYDSDSSSRKITCVNCTFINNSNAESKWKYGGAIEVQGLLTIRDCSFINCSSGMGGAIWCCDGIFMNSNFINNTAFEAGAIWGNKLILVGCSFLNNKAKIAGAILSDVSGFNITNCKFYNNHATGLGGAIYSYSKYVIDSGYHFAIVNSEFSNNSADYLTDYDDTKGMDSCKYSDFGAGSIFTYYRKSVVLKTLFSNCTGLDGNIPITAVIITSSKLTAPYNSGKFFKFTVSDKKTNNAIKNLPILLKIYIPKKSYSSAQKVHEAFNCFIEDIDIFTDNYYVVYLTSPTNSKGIASLKFNPAVGSYKIEVVPLYLNYHAPKLSSTIKINKAPTIIKAHKVTAKYKKSKYFKVTVKNKATKKAVKNIKVKIKVYTGKKYKTYNTKTNKNGVAKINTKILKRGTHKVVISSGNSNYKISAKSTIKIK